MRTAHLNEAPSGARFLDPAVLARIDTLELLARTVVEGFVNGLHRSPHLGLSTDFAEHRPYMPGDDIRRIDWKLYARTDRHYVKEFEAETNANVLFLLDVSRSMRFAGPGAAVSKLDYARFLVACLAYFSRDQRDRVGLATFDSDVVEFVPPSGRNLSLLLHALERAEAGRPGGLDAPARKIAQHLRRRSVVVVVSDLYEEPNAVMEALAHLRGKGNDLLLFQILDSAELEFPYDEDASFRDLESDESLPVIPERLRDRYREAIAAHTAAIAKLAGERGIDYGLFDTSKPLDDALFAYLNNRQRLMRVR